MKTFAASAAATAVGFVMAFASSARADVELKNDGFVSGGMASFQTGFVAGEAGAVRFVAPGPDRQLTKLQLLFGGAATMQTLTLRVYGDTDGTDDPGPIQFEGDFDLTGSDSAMQEVDLTPAAIYPPPQFRVAIVFQHAGAPSIATDADTTIAADKNFILVNGTTWRRASSLGLTGDFVVRAFVSGDTTPPPLPSCDVDTDCGDGTYCDTPHHLCASDCLTAGDCGPHQSCNVRGQCEGGDTSSPGGSGCDAGGGGAGWALGGLGLALLSIRRRIRS